MRLSQTAPSQSFTLAKSSRELRSAYKVLKEHSVSTLPCKLTLMGFLSLSRLSPSEVHNYRAYLTRYVPLSDFLSLVAVYSFQWLPVLFHTGSALGILSFRVFPSRRAGKPLGILAFLALHNYYSQASP